MGSQDDALRRMLKLVNSFFSRSDCIPFREPVDWRALELWDYPQIITKMMDLGTVKRKLERGQYQTAAECADDIRLIWTNCMTYNADGSDFFLLAESFSKRFEDRYRKIRQEFDTGENLGKSSSKEGRSKSSSSTSTSQTESFLSTSSQMEPPSLDAKTKFGSNLFRLTGVQLGHVLQVIDLKCPRALERPLTPNDPSNAPSSSLPPPNGENVEINVDAIDMKTFYELDHYVKERISKNRRKSSGEKEDSLSRSTSGSVLDNLSQSSTFTSNQYFRSNQSGSSGSGSSKKVGKRKR